MLFCLILERFFVFCNFFFCFVFVFFFQEMNLLCNGQHIRLKGKLFKIKFLLLFWFQIFIFHLNRKKKRIVSLNNPEESWVAKWQQLPCILLLLLLLLFLIYKHGMFFELILFSFEKWKKKKRILFVDVMLCL